MVKFQKHKNKKKKRNFSVTYAIYFSIWLLMGVRLFCVLKSVLGFANNYYRISIISFALNASSYFLRTSFYSISPVFFIYEWVALNSYVK